jgi:NAD(P)-dependent dehydrogenase (short-subunit alcohol dehydrogenase family)
LGRVVARQLAAQGHRVTVVGRREPTNADRDAGDIRYRIADILDPVARAAEISAVDESFGAPSYLVFCQRYRGQDDQWRGEFEVTLTATREIVEGLTPRFALQGDRGIVMVSSVFGDYVGQGQAVSYHVGKAGMNHLMRFYAANLGPRGIRVNAVTPFTFLKEESKDIYLKNEALMELYRKMIPLGRMATTQDVSNVIAFLCSSNAGFVTGQNIYVDGGLSVLWPEQLIRSLTKL